MSQFDDYRSEMSGTRLDEREIEQLLTRSGTVSEDLVDLEQFIAAISIDTEPPGDVSYMASSLAAVARASGRSAKRGLRRLAVVAASMAMLVALSGVAMAADGSAPGDALYTLDRALESIGIGDGGVDERIAEFENLLDRGAEDEALEFLQEVIAESPAADASKAADRLAAAPGLQPDPPGNGRGFDDAPGNSDSRPENGPPGNDPDGQPGNSGDAPGHNETPGQNQAPGLDRTPGEPASPDSKGQGNGVGQDPDTQPPGQEKAGQKTDLPDEAGPKESPGKSESSNPADNAPVQDPGNSQGQSNEPDQTNGQGQENQANGQDNGNGPGQNNGNGQDNGNGPGQNSGKGQGNGN